MTLTMTRVHDQTLIIHHILIQLLVWLFLRLMEMIYYAGRVLRGHIRSLLRSRRVRPVLR